MKYLFLIAGLFAASVASADQIVTRDLAFTCGVTDCLAPTEGTFTYDKSTKQFLSFLVTWDNIEWTFAGLTAANYRALIGAGPAHQKWTAGCIFDEGDPEPGNCGNGLYLQLFLVQGERVLNDVDGTTFSDGSPVAGGGEGFVTDPPISTPEPATLSLLIAGLIVLISLLPAASSIVRGGLRLESRSGF